MSSDESLDIDKVKRIPAVIHARTIQYVVCRIPWMLALGGSIWGAVKLYCTGHVAPAVALTVLAFFAMLGMSS